MSAYGRQPGPLAAWTNSRKLVNPRRRRGCPVSRGRPLRSSGESAHKALHFPASGTGGTQRAMSCCRSGMSSTRHAESWSPSGTNSTPHAMSSTPSAIDWSPSRTGFTPTPTSSTRDTTDAPKRGVSSVQLETDFTWSGIGSVRSATRRCFEADRCSLARKGGAVDGDLDDSSDYGHPHFAASRHCEVQRLRGRPALVRRKHALHPQLLRRQRLRRAHRAHHREPARLVAVADEADRHDR